MSLRDAQPAEPQRSQGPVWLGADRRGWNHVRIHVQLLRDDRLDAYHLAVYLGIAAHAELASGKAFPSASTLARYGGISDRKVRDVIHQLAEWGYLTIEPRNGGASVYTLQPPPPLQDVQGSSGREEPGAGGVGTTFQGGAAPGADEQVPGTRSKNDGRRRPPAADAAAVAARPVSDADARAANPCKQCDGDKLVDALGGAVVQCPRCSGSGIEPSRRVS